MESSLAVFKACMQQACGQERGKLQWRTFYSI